MDQLSGEGDRQDQGVAARHRAQEDQVPGRQSDWLEQEERYIF